MNSIEEMGTEVPQTLDSSGGSESNSHSDSENSDSCSSSSSGSEWACGGEKPAGARKPHFSVTSSDTGLKLKIAAIKAPRKNLTPPKAFKASKTTPTKKQPVAKSAAKPQKVTKKKTKSLSDTSSSSNSCSNCPTDSSSDDDLPLQAVTEAAKRNLRKKPGQPPPSGEKAVTEDSASEDDKKLSELDTNRVKSAKNNVKKTKSEVTTPPKRGRGRPRTKFAVTSPVAAETGCEAASSSSSSSSSSGSSSSSSSDSDTADTAAGGSANGSSADDSSAALVAACSLQVIDEEDLAALLPEQVPPAAPAQTSYPAYSVHATAPTNDDKSVADTGDGSSSEMELPPQLVTAAIQRATADSSGSDNECSNSAVAHQTGGHYASSLLQQFVAQTQLLSHSTPMTPMGGTVNPAIGCNIKTNPIEGVGINDCVLGQISTLPEINPIAPSFLTSDHLSEGNNHQHLSPQQTEELSQINKDLEEITSTVSAGLSIPNPPSLDDCVDNNDFMTLDITQAGIGSATDLLKSSPLTVISADMTPQSQTDSHKLDTVSTNSIESQEDVKVVVDVRKKRGRPRKVREEPKPESREEKSNNINDFCHSNDPPNVSPDSGILSNHNSPTHSPLRRNDVDVTQRVQKKSPLKENRQNEKRSSRSKSKSRTRRNSDSSECDYRVREIRQIKTEAPSPIPLKQEQSKPERPKKLDNKLDIAALDRMLYATDRVLYPPRRKNNRQQSKNAERISGKSLRDKSQTDSGDSDVETRRSVLSEVYAKRKDLNNKLASLPKKGNSKSINTSWRDHQSENEGQLDDPLDPTWRQIDLNPKYKDILSGYKSDHEIKPYKSCSRLMESGYKSDYGCRSGYRSDCFRSGYKSDQKSGYKSDKSGYKTDHSVRNIRRRMRKLKKSRSVRDRTYYKNQKHFVSDQEILVLANKTFSCLTLGHSTSDSDSDVYSCKKSSSPKFVSVSAKYPSLAPSFDFGFSSLSNKKKTPKSKVNSKDLFAPGPVFSGLGKQTQSAKFAKVNIFKTNTNNNVLVKSSSKANYFASPLPATAFTHKFGCAPISVASKIISNSKKNTTLNNNTMKQLSRNLSPKARKRNAGSVSPKLTNVFEKSRNAYVPNKSLSRNVFLNFKKPLRSPTLHVKKHKRPVVLAPPKINLKPTERLSRISLKTEPRHHRHKSKKRHRSRSASRCRDRETYTKTVDTIDQKFTQEMDNLVSNFIKLCQIAPKLVEKPPVKNTERREEKHKDVPEATITKCVKRGSKKRKTSDNLEASTPTTKRRHKKQLAESQTKGGKEATSANEHKLPLKKRHYHINSSTNNPLSLSLVSAEFDENAKIQNSRDTFLCTESNCMGDLQSVNESTKLKETKTKEKKTDATKVAATNVVNTEKNPEDVLKSIKSGINTTVESLTVQIDEAIEACISRYTSPNSAHATDDELSIKKPVGEHSELSKKIYETSEKLKAVHKMVHDLEKSLPKTKESEIKLDTSKPDAHKTSAPKVEPKVFPSRNSAPIVTPKKRHRLEADKILSNSSLDLVVQSLSKKLSEDKSSASEAPKTASPAHKPEDINLEKSTSNSPTLSVDSSTTTDPLKTMSVRALCKSSIPPAQKSEIMTRKKNRLEGLTSNLVSKINPSTATKMLDTLLNNNIRKSIESRILEKDKNNVEVSAKIGDEKSKSKETSHMNTRATVIKSPISKASEAKKLPKGTEILLEQTVVVNVDKPTGIFEPSVDLELQIPKSSISVNTLAIEKNDFKTKVKLRSSDNKSSSKTSKPTLDLEADLPLSLMSETTETIINRPRRSDSIASVISDKIQETASGHNLRQKRNLTNDSEKSSDEVNEKKKKKVGNNIIRESKLVLPSQMMQSKVPAEKVESLEIKKPAAAINIANPIIKSLDSSKIEPTIKKRTKRRAINRTGFPSVKKKKKKLSVNPNNSQTDLTDQSTTESVFERVPKLGEATYSFLERTTLKKPTELKVILNKEDCPRQGRLSVISLERLQGKELLENNNTLKKSHDNSLKNEKLLPNAIPTVTIQHLKNSKTDRDQTLVNKWEIMSETDSIPSLVSSSGNDPEDSIPLSLLNLKPERPSSQMDRIDRLKRKTHELSPSQEVEDIILSKRKLLDKNQTRLRSKSSLAMLCPSERRQTRSADTDINDKTIKTNEKKKTLEVTEKDDITAKPDRVTARRKSRSCQAKKSREITSSSRDSSLDTLKSLKMSPKTREASVDNFRRDHCFENDPLPLNEKEIDFEKSIDVISKNVICKKRMASSRDDSPASSCERNKSDRDRPAISKRNPRLRKKFLAAGLFSDYYKENDPKPLDAKAKSLISQSDFPTGLLAPPPYCERWVRQRKQHFQLPYDIWWQHQYNQPVPSWNYKKIRSNVYYDVKPSADECESVACNCAPCSGCPEECINRLVFAECSPQLCPCKDRCKNQRIQKHEWSSGLERFMTVHKGWGVRANSPITSGDFILEYVGEVVSDKVFKERMASRYARDTHHYCLHLDGGLVIDGHRMGGDGRFVNHSCLPNCEMQKWTANGTFRMALFALRDIEPGEELTYDYNFSLFNPAEGQPCKCDSENCRGVIGGKSQRIAKPPPKSQRTCSGASGQAGAGPAQELPATNRVGRPRKSTKCNKKCDGQRSASMCDLNNYQQHLSKLWQEPQVKPLTARERAVVRDRHCFLFRNLEKVRKMRDTAPLPNIPPRAAVVPEPPPAPPALPVTSNINPLSLPSNLNVLSNVNINPSVFLTRLQALRAPRTRTRRLALAEDNPELSRQARLASVFRELYNVVVEAKDEENKPFCASFLRRKDKPSGLSETVPTDLATIEANIESGHYKSVGQLDADVSGVLNAVWRDCGRQSEAGVAARQLRKVYNNAKTEFAEQLTKILGPNEPLPPGFIQKNKPEEVIMCICGLHFEEGLMVQCGGAGCGVWQHARCMQVTDTSAPHHCHKCQPRPVDLEIPLDEYTEEGHQFYLSLMRAGLQIRQGDTVYVLRDIPVGAEHPDRSAAPEGSRRRERADRKKGKRDGKKDDDAAKKSDEKSDVQKHTYKTIGEIPVSELDIFRVERLWKHKATGERFVYGHHYLRPHETYHEPTRKFFPNEVMRVPLYEAVPIDLVMSQCWVMDVNTYCKGRPVCAVEEHVYICELRVDRGARLFTKVSRPKYPICTKTYAFDHFPQRLKISRTYAPHEVSPEYLKGRAGRSANADKDSKSKGQSDKGAAQKKPSSGQPAPSLQQANKNREKQKDRLNRILVTLLSRSGCRQPLDVSYLLEGRRQRKKNSS